MGAKGQTQPEAVDAERGETGLAVSIVETPAGKMRLVCDDVLRVGKAPVQWKTRCLFTHVDFEAAEFLGSNLDEEDYRNIGRAVVARLSALYRASRK